MSKREFRDHFEMKFEEKKGDLFSAQESLAHCVSRDFYMGKGIALDFKKRFQRVRELHEQEKGIGDVATLLDGERFIYYLVTKDRFYHKPTYASLRQSIRKMKEHMVENGITELAIPKIGCGLDRLDWDTVKEMILEEFRDLEKVTVTVYIP